MQISKKIKSEQQDNIIEELLREKAAVLARAGMAVEDVLEKLTRIEREIEEKEMLLNLLEGHDACSELSREKQLICDAINISIDKFNIMHKKAETQYYYLIVTREALGLRRHEMVQKMYRIPDKKKKYGMVHG